MEELVKKFIDSLIEQAKTEAAKLAGSKFLLPSEP